MIAIPVEALPTDDGILPDSLLKVPYHHLPLYCTAKAPVYYSPEEVVEEMQNRIRRFVRMTDVELAQCKSFLQAHEMFEDVLEARFKKETA